MWVVGRLTLHGGPVRLRPVRATPCFIFVKYLVLNNFHFIGQNCIIYEIFKFYVVFNVVASLIIVQNRNNNNNFCRMYIIVHLLIL